MSQLENRTGVRLNNWVSWDLTVSISCPATLEVRPSLLPGHWPGLGLLGRRGKVLTFEVGFSWKYIRGTTYIRSNVLNIIV